MADSGSLQLCADVTMHTAAARAATPAAHAACTASLVAAASTVETDLGHEELDRAVHLCKPPPPTPLSNSFSSLNRCGAGGFLIEFLIAACRVLFIVHPHPPSQNNSGMHDVHHANQFGTVVYDWSNAKAIWANAHPMTSEELITKQAEMVYAQDPGLPGYAPRVWAYRNTIKALNWYSSVREKLDDPKYASWFIKFKGFADSPYPGGQSKAVDVLNASFAAGDPGAVHVPPCDWYNNGTAPRCSGFYHDQEQTPEHPGGGGPYHVDGDCTMTSTSFWTIFCAFSSSTPPHTRCGPCSTWCPVLPHADWCLQSDVMPNLGLQARSDRTIACRCRVSSPTLRAACRPTTTTSKASAVGLVGVTRASATKQAAWPTGPSWSRPLRAAPTPRTPT